MTRTTIKVARSLSTAGRRQLAKFLTANLNDKSLAVLLSAWESDIQFNVHEDCTGDIEISGFYTASGNPFSYRFSGDEVEVIEEEIEDEE